jgi:hypothetical protein
MDRPDNLIAFNMLVIVVLLVCVSLIALCGQ